MAIRVLHIVTYMGRGGLETMLMNYYRNIDRNKIQFDFLVHRKERADYDDEIEAMGGRIYRISRLNPFRISYRKELKHFFEEHKEYRMIHVHQDCLSSVALKVGKQCGIPIRIAHSHNASQDKNLKYLIKMFYKQSIAKYATHLLACSKEAGQWMFGGADFQILNNAIDAEKYTYNENVRKQLRDEMGILPNELVVGHVGRFFYQKNHEFLIDIFEALTKKVSCKLLLVGDGELRTKIEDRVQAKNLEDRVIFTGIREDVANLMQAMDVFVFPSYYEGLPVTLVEAQAAGLPCLISDHISSDCKKTELIHQMSLSVSTEIWADKILKLSKLSRKNTCEEIRSAGFDIKENATSLQEYYFSLNTGEKECQL